MSQEKTLNPNESLQLIQEMIANSRKKYQKNNFYYLMWGWLLLISGVAEYVLHYPLEYDQSWIVWPIQGIVGGIISFIYGAKASKKAQTTTALDRIFTGLWMSFVICLILMIVFTVMVFKTTPTPHVLLLTGLPTIVSGIALKFKPLIVGGGMFWAWGIVSFLIPFEYCSIIFSAAILTGYIIPGYLLKNKEENV